MIPSGKLLHNYGKSPCYYWEYSRHFDYMPCSIAMCARLPEGVSAMFSWAARLDPPHPGDNIKRSRPHLHPARFLARGCEVTMLRGTLKKKFAYESW